MQQILRSRPTPAALCPAPSGSFGLPSIFDLSPLPRGERGRSKFRLLHYRIFVGSELTNPLHGKQSRRHLDLSRTKHRKFDLLNSSVVTVAHGKVHEVTHANH